MSASSRIGQEDPTEGSKIDRPPSELRFACGCGNWLGFAEAHVARGCALAVSREYAAAARAFEWSQRALEPNPDDTSALINAACVRIRAGQRNQALALFERVFARGRGKRDWVEYDPDYESLRGDPRFE